MQRVVTPLRSMGASIGGPSGGMRLPVEVTALPRHAADHRRRTADLAGDIDEPPPLRVETERELLLLATEMTMLALQRMPPEISVCFISQHSLR